MRCCIGSTLAYLLLMATLAQAQEKSALPEGAVARLGVHRLRVPGAIFDAAFTPDQRTFVVVFHERNEKQPNVILFDVATGLERKRLDVASARHVAMARHNPLMVLDSTKGFEVWDVVAEKLIKQWRYPDLAYNTSVLAIAPDGAQVVAAASEGNKPVILRWDATTGNALPSVYPGTNAIYTVSFSADGSKFFTASSPSVTPGPGANAEKNPKITPGAVITWDAKTGKKLAEMTNRHDFVVFSPDGTKIARAGSNDKTIEIVAFDASGKILAETVAGHTRFDFTPDSKQLVIQTNHNGLQLWDIAANKEVRTFEGQIGSHRHQPRFTRDGRTLAVLLNEGWSNDSGFVQFFDVANGKQIGFATGHPSTVNGLAYSPDGRWIATISSDMLLVFDAKTGDELRRWVGHKASVEQIAFSPDGKLLASASVDGTIGLWDPATGKERKRLKASDSVKSFAFSRDGKTLIAVNWDRRVQTWDIDKGVVLSSHQLAFLIATPLVSPTGDYLAYFEGVRNFYESALLHWSHARTGKTFPPIDLHRNKEDKDGGGQFEGTLANAFAFSADSKLLATSDSLVTHSIRTILSDHTIRVWETATRKEILRLSNVHVGTRLLALSDDGRILAYGVGERKKWGHGEDKTIMLSDISTGQSNSLGNKTELGGHLGNITCLTFSPDGQFLATGGSDQVAYIWRVSHFLNRSAPPDVKHAVAALWPHLADADASKAYQAIAKLERRPKEAMALLRQHLGPVPTADAKAIAEQLHDLSSATFAVRQKAYASLEKSGEQAGHLVQAALKDPPSLEVKRRLEMLLEKLDRPLEDPAQLRAYRCLTLLQRIDSKESRQFLEELSRGAPAAWLTTESRYALKR